MSDPDFTTPSPGRVVRDDLAGLPADALTLPEILNRPAYDKEN